MPVRITIDPRFRVSYASYYIEGINSSLVNDAELYSSNS